MMRQVLRMVVVLVLTIGCSIVATTGARAADETVTTESTFFPINGPFHPDTFTPSNWKFSAEVKAPYPDSETVQPLKRLRIGFPPDAELQIHDSVTPPCSDNKIGPATNLNFPPDIIVARCPKSVLGNGTAGLYLAGGNSGAGPTLRDVVLVVFYGGENDQGDPKIKIYGYSAQTGVGLYLHGIWDGSTLDLAIPRITFDTGIGELTLDLPGSNSPIENRRGQDPEVVRAKCSTGSFATSADFTLGTRDSDGLPTSPETDIQAPESIMSCSGTPGGGGPYRLVVTRKGNGRGTVRSIPAGIRCGSKCSAEFPEERHVTLTAKPGRRSIFAGWSGICGGRGKCRVTVSETKRVTANFTPKRLSGPVGISVERGARSTDDRRVDIRVVWPAGSTRMKLANSPDFRGARSFEVKRTVKWFLDQDRRGNRPATVYARFDGSRKTFSDDILLTKPR